MAFVTSAHISLANANYRTKFDVIGAKCYNPSTERGGEYLKKIMQKKNHIDLQRKQTQVDITSRHGRVEKKCTLNPT